MLASTLDAETYRVVILDDQSTGRRILEQLVRSIGLDLQIAVFEDPHAALRDVNAAIPDLILTDYVMPAMDGVEVVRRIRAVPACVDVPIVMITVSDDRRVRYEALDAGATDFLSRPVDPYECRARCRNLLLLRQQQKIIQDRALWLERQVAAATQQIQARERETLLRLAKAGEYRDEGTGNHVLRIARYSRLIAESMGLSSEHCEDIELAAPMHDIGKVGIPDKILLKPGRLTKSELRIMRTHARIGYEILKESPSHYLQLGATIALAHHEKFDGSGYPNALTGEDIPLEARIVAVADVYDALTTKRSYKPALPIEEALTYLRLHAGSHFDPRCVDALMREQASVRRTGETLKDVHIVYGRAIDPDPTLARPPPINDVR